ncbi:hypothetical protein CKO09_04900 [Chromatium weissei]|nr:hypothetical protein [Chromatium weissei]
MKNELLAKYLQYAKTEEALAVLFVKKHLVQAKGHWVDIVDYQRCEIFEERHHRIISTDNFYFRFVIGNLYKRKIQPKYPSKAAYTIDGKFDEREYYLMARAITWETAHRDIEQQKSKNVAAQQFKITGVIYDKNKGNPNYFLDDAPPEIKALANDLCDRTNPLWDRAERYINKPEFVYKIKKIYIA